ncbi:hypothetical protein AB0K48_33710 [Nonomuraea sp. NPDC055795]
MTFFDPLLVLLPLAALGNALWRAIMSPGAALTIFRTGFLVAGAALLLLALISSSGVFGGSFAASSEALDVTVKAGFGMMLGALACGISQWRKDNHVSAGGAQPQDDRDQP